MGTVCTSSANNINEERRHVNMEQQRHLTSSEEPKDIDSWDVNDVYNWLSTEADGELLGLAKKFRAARIRGRILDNVTDTQLQEMNITIGDRLLFQTVKEELFAKYNHHVRLPRNVLREHDSNSSQHTNITAASNPPQPLDLTENRHVSPYINPIPTAAGNDNLNTTSSANMNASHSALVANTKNTNMRNSNANTAPVLAATASSSLRPGVPGSAFTAYPAQPRVPPTQGSQSAYHAHGPRAYGYPPQYLPPRANPIFMQKSLPNAKGPMSAPNMSAPNKTNDGNVSDSDVENNYAEVDGALLEGLNSANRSSIRRVSLKDIQRELDMDADEIVEVAQPEASIKDGTAGLSAASLHQLTLGTADTVSNEKEKEPVSVRDIAKPHLRKSMSADIYTCMSSADTLASKCQEQLQSKSNPVLSDSNNRPCSVGESLGNAMKNETKRKSEIMTMLKQMNYGDEQCSDTQLFERLLKMQVLQQMEQPLAEQQEGSQDEESVLYRFNEEMFAKYRQRDKVEQSASTEVADKKENNNMHGNSGGNYCNGTKVKVWCAKSSKWRDGFIRNVDKQSGKSWICYYTTLGKVLTKEVVLPHDEVRILMDNVPDFQSAQSVQGNRHARRASANQAYPANARRYGVPQSMPYNGMSPHRHSMSTYQASYYPQQGPSRSHHPPHPQRQQVAFHPTSLMPPYHSLPLQQKPAEMTADAWNNAYVRPFNHHQ